MPELPFDPPNAAPLRPPVAGRSTHHYGQKDILVMYPALRLDHLRYLEKCGLIKPAFKSGADTFFSFSDLTTLRQLAGELRQGAVWRAAVRHLQASRVGQLAFDFRLDAQPARIIDLKSHLGTLGTLGTPGTPGTDGSLKDAFLSEIKSAKSTFYNLVVASAYSIEVSADKIVFAFQPNKKNAKGQCDEQKAWLMTVAEKVAGRPVPVAIVFAEADAPPAPAPSNLGSPVAKPKADPGDLKAEAMANSTVQAVLEIFPVDKTTIEER